MVFSRSLFPRPVTAVFLLLGALPFIPLAHAGFIHPASFKVTEILPPPPQPGTEQYRIDTSYLKNARSTATKEQITKAVAASNDSVFDYSQTLGPWFNARNLPKTAALFAKVTKETDQAIDVAKHSFNRGRPREWFETGDPAKSLGYSYPSGHTTRAFVWADLLAVALPSEQKALHRQGRQKGWYRVILGRHFPADVRAGKLYGRFLTSQFLQDPAFQKEWVPVVAELRLAREKALKQH